ncbi:hypothetical protein [Streptomyces radicis]|uniref:Uncharacterized protein n=1 Tax=Streptomyces radicis TaxID=1750517 RepID=A0A3A9WDV3_9ACTN|nr:hypothetical protein [Streptomyces radicis]RKN11511.1 hypothetical protein D7319_06135 [Streptomyces radicis]RKN26470.1 hypothetical protein D7318_03525 [Streptomyces radicis]
MVQRTSRDAGRSARDDALAVLRVRNGALALALIPAASAVVLFAAGAPGALRWPVTALAAATAAVATATGLFIARARPAVTPTIEVPERSAPALHGLIRELADRLDVPPPSGIALTPDCDSWLEEPPRVQGAAAPPGPVLVIGSPFLWWMRVGELRALLAPVVAGTGPAAHPDIASARRCVRAWDAAAGLARGVPRHRRPLTAFSGLVARVLLRLGAGYGAEMERGVARAAAARAQGVDEGLRSAAQEQVGLAYAGWDRLLTRVALPAWRIGRWPRGLDAGVVSALTELSRRDRLAEGFAARLGERPACDLLEEPGAMDEAISLLAARLFHGTQGRGDADWTPVDWTAYPDEVVDRIWRDRAARLFAALDAAETPTLACALQRLADAAAARDGTAALAARLVAEAARAESRAPTGAAAQGPPPPGDREALVEHVSAAICCAAADTTGAAPGLDWLDGPVLLTGGTREHDLAAPVHSLVDDGDPGPLRDWLAGAGVRPDKPVRLV